MSTNTQPLVKKQVPHNCLMCGKNTKKFTYKGKTATFNELFCFDCSRKFTKKQKREHANETGQQEFLFKVAIFMAVIDHLPLPVSSQQYLKTNKLFIKTTYKINSFGDVKPKKEESYLP